MGYIATNAPPWSFPFKAIRPTQVAVAVDANASGGWDKTAMQSYMATHGIPAANLLELDLQGSVVSGSWTPAGATAAARSNAVMDRYITPLRNHFNQIGAAALIHGPGMPSLYVSTGNLTASVDDQAGVFANVGASLIEIGAAARWLYENKAASDILAPYAGASGTPLALTGNTTSALYTGAGPVYSLKNFGAIGPELSVLCGSEVEWLFTEDENAKIANPTYDQTATAFDGSRSVVAYGQVGWRTEQMSSGGDVVDSSTITAFLARLATAWAARGGKANRSASKKILMVLGNASGVPTASLGWFAKTMQDWGLTVEYVYTSDFTEYAPMPAAGAAFTYANWKAGSVSSRAYHLIAGAGLNLETFRELSNMRTVSVSAGGASLVDGGYSYGYGFNLYALANQLACAGTLDQMHRSGSIISFLLHNTWCALRGMSVMEGRYFLENGLVPRSNYIPCGDPLNGPYVPQRFVMSGAVS